MAIEVVEPVPSRVNHSPTGPPSRRLFWSKWVKRALVSLAVCSTVFYGIMTWSARLTPEEQMYAGRWVSIDSSSVTYPNGTTISTLLRELELMPGHEVRINIWLLGTETDVRRIFMFSARGALFPQGIRGPNSVIVTPHPAILPDSVVKSSPSTEATGRWRIENGRVEIKWDLNISPIEQIHETYSRYTRTGMTIRTNTEANGTVTCNRDNQLTIQWIWKSSAINGYTPPPQVWSRQSD